MRKISSLLMMALLTIGMGLTSCDEQLDNAVTPYTPGVTPTVEDVIKYGFKVTDLTGVDLTGDVTSLKMSNEDGSEVVEAEVSGGKITIKNTDLTAASFTAAIDFWFEATVGTRKYVAKVNIDPTALSPETDKTLEMATLGDVILSDGKFAARTSTTGTKVAMIAYLGSETGFGGGRTHGLALALTDTSSSMDWTTAQGPNGAYAHIPADPPTTSSWMLPSKDQWNKMIDACKNVLGDKNTYEDLRDGFSDISDANNLQGGTYWSSTETDADNACVYYFSSGDWNDNFNKSNERIVRACLAF